MPLVLNKAACYTCRRRKLKCDEKQPICDRCQRANRYCDRKQELKIRQHCQNAKIHKGAAAFTEPRAALEDNDIAELFHYYIKDLAPWYDLSDSEESFAKLVPQKALSQPLLFQAVIAFAAIHMSRTTASSLRQPAEHFHSQCIQLLIKLTEDEVRSANGIALAAVCLLRSYEILAEETDPNRHLSGAYALVIGQPIDTTTPSLLRAGFFNFLREDITFSLIHRRPLKMDLGTINETYAASTEEDQLNVVTLLLAETINAAFCGSRGGKKQMTLTHRLDEFKTSLPPTFVPFSESSDPAGSTFPSIRMLRDCHVAALQYHLVAHSVVDSIQTSSNESETRLHDRAVRLCGLAFTSGSPSVIVNSFGPIAFCCCWLQTQALQSELVRRLHASRKHTGWPVQRIIDDLHTHWANA